MNSVNTPSQTQSELRKQVETTFNKKKFFITIDLSYLVGVNVVFGVFSRGGKRPKFEIDVIQRCLPRCCLIINFNFPWCLKDPLLT